jgi:hypothetical protein
MEKDNFKNGLLSAARASVETGLVVTVAEIEHQKCSSFIGL